MITRQRPLGFMVALALTFALVLGLGFTGTAQAASEDVAMFYDDLSQYGEWVDMEIMGRSGVPTRWRRTGGPIPTGAGCPPTTATSSRARNRGAGPPTTTATGCPPKTTAGSGCRGAPGTPPRWSGAPVPKAKRWTPRMSVGPRPRRQTTYRRRQSYAPSSYYPGSPGVDSLASPLWIFVRAAQFLLGFGQPYDVELFLYELRVF